MAAFTINEPGTTLGSITAVAVAAASTFTLSQRASAIVGLSGTEEWAWSSDNVNFVIVPADTAWALPVLDGDGSVKTYYFKRTGSVDSVISVWVAG